MAPEKSDDQKRPAFKVSDRRSFSESGEPKDAAPAAAATDAPVATDAPPSSDRPSGARDATPAAAGLPDDALSGQPETATPGPRDATGTDATESSAADAPTGAREFAPVDFHTFILSLGSSALLHLGELDQPDGKESRPDLPLAKHTIDIIGMLQTKTRGNLSPPEERLIESLLYDLRLRYVERLKA